MADNTSDWGSKKAQERYMSGNTIPPRTASERIKDSLGLGSRSTFKPTSDSYKSPSQSDRDALSNMAKKSGGRADPLPEHPSPPIQPKEWPPHPLRATGGKVHSDEAQDRALFNKMFKKAEAKEEKKEKAEGKASGGEVKPFPIPMKISDLNRLRGIQGVESGRIPVTDKKPIPGPGYTKAKGGKVK